MFSHKGLVHLVFNCMALSSFGAATSHFLAAEQINGPTGLREASPKWHFLAFFISAGLFSGLVSHVASATIRYPRLISQMVSAEAAAKTAVTTTAAKTAAPKTLDLLPSLGASGAVYAAAALTALAFPETQIALIFPPISPIPIQYGIGAMVMIDMIGILRGWRLLDHWAHLGGAAFGGFYYAYGPQLWDHMRRFPYTSAGRSPPDTP
jgi:rhomboid-like protein